MTESNLSNEPSLERILEAVLSVSESPVSIGRMQKLFPDQGRPQAQEIEQALSGLANQYENSALELVNIANGYRFQTRKTYAQWINKLFETRPPRLSRALLETLSIIAYQQPVTRGDIQDVRGVAVSSDIIQRLLEREWIKKVGERDVPGRPSLFGTTAEFLAYFNLSSLQDLPQLREPRELDEIAQDIGRQAELELESQAPAEAEAEPEHITTPLPQVQDVN
jgi:segregation and condensation protein B